MKTNHARWFEIVLALVVGLFLARPLGNFSNAVGDLVTDASFFRFDREHHLAHGHISRTSERLFHLQQALLHYSQAHNGDLSPLKSAYLVRQKLLPFTADKKCFTNLDSVPFQPNSSLANFKYVQIKNSSHTVLFYDEAPPATYPQVYFVTLDGKLQDTSSNDWIRLQRLWHVNQSVEPLTLSTR